MSHVCKRCGYEWTGKAKTENPVACPKCKSYLWNTERRAKKGQPEPAVAADEGAENE